MKFRDENFPNNERSYKLKIFTKSTKAEETNCYVAKLFGWETRIEIIV